jgi:23S rRNA pseudouridine2605 synthase
MMSERLQKVLARAGYGSRRKIEELIREGRITVNGTVARLGDRVSPEDTVRVEGERVRIPGPARRPRVIAYHKPEGEICTRSDPGGRPTIFDSLPPAREGRWVSVGRLDINTSGLILLTDDGELANRLMHPSTGIEREYAVRVQGEVKPATIRRLLAGVRLPDGRAGFEWIEDVGGRGVNHWYRVRLREGRHHAVRRIWESQRVRVSRLIRIRYGPIALPRDLHLGRWRELRAGDLDRLLAAVERGAKADRGGPPRKRRR